jgi:hypothetical protein
MAMKNPGQVFLYIGTYPDELSARADYDVVKGLHAAGAVGTYDASVGTKDQQTGKVPLNKDDMACRHGTWGGAARRRCWHPVSICDPRLRRSWRGGGWRGRPSVALHVPGRRERVWGPDRPGQAAFVIVGESTIEDAVKQLG